MTEKLPLKGRVAVVTGGASGIGLASSTLLRKRGARVVAVDIDEAALARMCPGDTADVLPLVADNRSVASIEAACATILAWAGRVDILVNCAGVSGYSRPIAEIDEAMFDLMMATHVKGAFFWVRAVLPALRSPGRIINIASDFAMTGFPSMSHYVAAKSAMLGLTKAWAREFAERQITVNAVAPGLVSTSMTEASLGHSLLAERGSKIPLGRLATANDIAYAVAWLASDEAAMMTGQTVSPNGGNSIVGI